MMSAQAVNSALVLPPAPTSSLSLTAPPVKISPPSPPCSKSPVSQNHSSPVPLSLVHENKAKAPENSKESVPNTPNGIDEPTISIPPPSPASKEVVAPPVADETPAAVAQPINLSEKATPTMAPVASPVPEPDAPVSVVEKSEPAPPKPAKPQGAKRRREQSAASELPPQDEGVPGKKPRRARAPVHHYQCPLPEITTVINRSLKITDNTPKPQQEKLVIFFKNEFLAVRNAEGGFFLCQTLQNIFRTSHKIRIRWLSMDEKEKADDGGVYTRDFYDTTDFECILTNVALNKEGKNKYKLPNTERDRVENILKRGLDVEKGVSEKPSVTEDHPDGIDISLYRDEAQLKKAKKSIKRKRSPVKTSSPKKAKISTAKPKESKTETIKTKAKAKSKKKETKKVVAKAEVEKPKSSRAERNAAREKLAEKEALKVSPPNEKARVVTKILRKNIDPSPVKGEGSNEKKASSSAAKSTKKAAKQDKIDTKKVEKKKGKSHATSTMPVVTPSTGSGSKKAIKSEKNAKEAKRRLAPRKGRK